MTSHDYCAQIKEAARLTAPLSIRYLENATSTNTILRDAAKAGEKETVLLIAETQSAGRGRFDRRFFSPAGTGVYMSLLLHPTFSPALFSLVTPMAGAAAAEAAEAVFGRPVQVKWVNDLYRDGKKAAGILAESGFCGADAYLVLGIGINVYPPGDMPEELSGILGTLSDKTAGEEDKRPLLIGAFLSRFFSYYDAIAEKSFLEAYRSRSLLEGKRFSCITPPSIRQRRAKAERHSASASVTIFLSSFATKTARKPPSPQAKSRFR